MQKFKKLLTSIGMLVVIPAAVYAIFCIVRPDAFLTSGAVYSVFLQSCAACVLAWGISFSLTAGITDFSVAAERILGTVLGVILSRSMGIAGLVIGCLAVAIVCGVIKAILNSMIKMSSMVISIAYVYILGAVGSIVQGTNSMILTSDMCVLGKSPAIWIITAVCGLIMFLLNHYSVFGANCRALGGSNKIAREAGVSKGKTEGKAIIFASIFAAISGIMATSYGAGTVAQTGLASMSIIFPAIIGVNIGLLLTKWVDITFGTIAGVVTMNILGTGLTAMGVPAQLKDTFTGAFLLILMCLSSFLSMKRAEKVRRQASELAAQAAGAAN